MAEPTPYTRPGALQVPHGASSLSPVLAVRMAFSAMLASLAQLLRVEAVGGYDGVMLDLDATTDAYATVDAMARAVLDLPPVQPSDRALQTGAFVVRLAIGMEDPVDRAAVLEVTDETRTRLMLAPDDPDADVVNRFLAVAFDRLDQLAALDAELAADMDREMDIGDDCAAFRA